MYYELKIKKNVIYILLFFIVLFLTTSLGVIMAQDLTPSKTKSVYVCPTGTRLIKYPDIELPSAEQDNNKDLYCIFELAEVTSYLKDQAIHSDPASGRIEDLNATISFSEPGSINPLPHPKIKLEDILIGGVNALIEVYRTRSNGAGTERIWLDMRQEKDYDSNQPTLDPNSCPLTGNVCIDPSKKYCGQENSFYTLPGSTLSWKCCRVNGATSNIYQFVDKDKVSNSCVNDTNQDPITDDKRCDSGFQISTSAKYCCKVDDEWIKLKCEVTDRNKCRVDSMDSSIGVTIPPFVCKVKMTNLNTGKTYEPVTEIRAVNTNPNLCVDTTKVCNGPNSQGICMKEWDIDPGTVSTSVCCINSNGLRYKTWSLTLKSSSSQTDIKSFCKEDSGVDQDIGKDIDPSNPDNGGTDDNSDSPKSQICGSDPKIAAEDCCAQYAKTVPTEKQDSEKSSCLACLSATGGHFQWTSLGCIDTTLSGLVTSVLRIFYGIGGGLLILRIAIAGVKLSTNPDDPGALKESRAEITASVIAFVFGVLSLMLLKFIGINILGITWIDTYIPTLI